MSVNTVHKVEPHYKRISRVYRYIKQNLRGDLSLDRLADVACLSPYHFHRVYKNLVGETLVGAARRCRLYRAGKMLTETNSSLARIAYSVGYERIDSFSRAFQRYYGVAPGVYRRDYFVKQGLLQTARLFGADSGFRVDMVQNSGTLSLAIDELYSVELVDLPRVELVCLESDSSQEALEPKFVDLNLYAQSYSLDLSNRCYLGLFYKDYDCRNYHGLVHRLAMAALPLNLGERDVLERFCGLPFKFHHLDGGSYASYLYKGPYSLSENGHEWLLNYWLPVNGLRAEKAPIVEVYLNDPRKVGPSQLNTRVLVKVTPI